MRDAAVAACRPFDFVLSPTAPVPAFAAELAVPDQRPGAPVRAHRVHAAVQHERAAGRVRSTAATPRPACRSACRSSAAATTTWACCRWRARGSGCGRRSGPGPHRRPSRLTREPPRADSERSRAAREPAAECPCSMAHQPVGMVVGRRNPPQWALRRVFQRRRDGTSIAFGIAVRSSVAARRRAASFQASRRAAVAGTPQSSPLRSTPPARFKQGARRALPARSLVARLGVRAGASGRRRDAAACEPVARTRASSGTASTHTGRRR